MNLRSVEEKALNKQLIKMAENEARMLKTLNHPSIMNLIDIFKDDKNHYLVTEYCEGLELFE